MKRFFALFMIMVLILSGATGCGKPAEEEAAAIDQVVENERVEETPEEEQEAPEKVEENEATDTPEKPEEKPEEPEETPSEEEPSLPEKNEPAKEEEPEEEPEADQTTDNANLLKIVDYNIRGFDDGENKNIFDRAPRFKILMDRLDPDLIGLQEVTEPWISHLESDFSEKYEIFHQWRAASNHEGTPILWKKSKFELMDSGYFWLSDTPEVESKADNWGADCYRICMWVKLKIKATGKEFLYYNTHYDFTEEIHINSSNVILKQMKKQGSDDLAVFLTGDFNMGPDTGGHITLTSVLEDINRDLDQEGSITTDGYNEGDGSGSIIDFCFYSPDKAEPVIYDVLNEMIEGGYISDHRGLYIEAIVK